MSKKVSKSTPAMKNAAKDLKGKRLSESGLALEESRKIKQLEKRIEKLEKGKTK
jgi:hypothetical protein